MLLVNIKYQKNPSGGTVQTLEVISEGMKLGIVEQARCNGMVNTITRKMSGESVRGLDLDWLRQQAA